MVLKRTRTPDEILREAERKRRNPAWVLFFEEYVIFKLIIWFIEWIGVLRFFFLASLLCAIASYAYSHLTLAAIFLIVSLCFAIGMYVQPEDSDQ
jgi:hypothetical protein